MPSERKAILTSVSDFYLEVSKGSVIGHSPLLKFGRNGDIDAAAVNTVGRDIWDGGVASAVDWVPPTEARIHAIAGGATDALDDVGAHTIIIFGLGPAYELQDEILSMHPTDGTTPVNTLKLYTMIHRMYVLSAGSADKNVANITATAAVDGTVTAMITANNSQTAMAIFQIPAETTCYLDLTYASLHKKGGPARLADTALMLKDFGGVWRFQDSLAVSSDSGQTAQNPYTPPLTVPAMSYIKMVGNPTADGQDISAGFYGVLVAN
jgi:hypothetical protein